MDEWATEIANQLGMDPAEVEQLLQGVTNAIEPKSLYVTETELCEVILGKRSNMVNWRQIVAVWELEPDFPPKDPNTGRRYWPAVAAWCWQPNAWSGGRG